MEALATTRFWARRHQRLLYGNRHDSLAGGGGDDTLLGGSAATPRRSRATCDYRLAWRWIPALGTCLTLTDTIGGRDGTDTLVDRGAALPPTGICANSQARPAAALPMRCGHAADEA